MNAEDPKLLLKIGDFTLDLSSRSLYRGEERVRLTAKPFEVLTYLARSNRRVVPKEELLSAVWGELRGDNTVEQAVRQIRLALQDDKDEPRFIQTVSGKGYCFVATAEEVGAVPATPPPEPAPGSSQPASKPWTRRMVLGAAGTAVLAGAALLVRSRVRRIERAVLSGDLLTAMDGLGRTVWTQRFRGMLDPPSAGDSIWRVQILDLEGDGHPGVVAACNHGAGFHPPHSENDEIVYVGPEGKVRWTYVCQPGLLDFDGQAFEPLWCCTHLIAVPSRKGQELWAGIHHGWRFPGCVMRLDAGGAASLQFANTGFVERLCNLARRDGNCVAVCGENNAFDRSFAAVLGVRDPPSSSPAGGPNRRSFANAPSGSPRDYVLFPTTEMLRATDAPYGHATDLSVTGDGGFVTYVHAGDTDKAALLYEFSPRTEARAVMPGGSNGPAHARLQAEGKLDHPLSKCPELSQPLTIRHWRPASGWSDEPVPWRGVPLRA